MSIKKGTTQAGKISQVSVKYVDKFGAIAVNNRIQFNLTRGLGFDRRARRLDKQRDEREK